MVEMVGTTEMTETTAQQRNWAGNITFHAARLHYPETIADIQRLVSDSSKVRVLGSRHSFNDIADTTGDLLSLTHFIPALTFDHERHTVTVGAGATYGEISREIHAAGYALHNMASLPHISVAGACATATHGSGDGNGNLATAVAAMELVTADGTVVTLSRAEHGEQFLGAVVGLGALGVVTKLTLNLVPTFAMRQDVYENLPLAQLEAHFEEIASSAYSVSLFTNWQDERVKQVWRKRRVTDDTGPEAEPTFFEATLARTDLHPLGTLSAAATTPQRSTVGPWHERLPHFRMEFIPSNGEELQTEYFVPRPHAVAAFRVMHGLRDQIAPLLQISEVRTIAADDLWMSPCYEQASVALHFTWKKDWEGVQKLLPLIEEQLAPFNARPHWGKVFTMPATQVQSRYPKLPEFAHLLRSYDPEGKFRNAFLDAYI